MTNPALSTKRPAIRRGKAVVAVMSVGLLAACSSVGSSATSSSGGGADSTAGNTYGTPAKASEVKDGGNLVFGLSADPDALDPTTSHSLYSRYVFDSMCQKLYDVNAQTAVVPQLATALPVISNGGKTYTITVRSGVKFADGTDFNADAVKTTLERDLTLAGSTRKSELGPITSIDATNATTVVIQLSTPFAPLTAALSDRAGMIMSPTALQTLGANFSTDPTCVGPYKFSKRVPANSITLVKDPNFYDAKDVHFDSITYQILTDPNIRAANLKAGSTQVTDTLSPSNVADLQAQKNLTVLKSNSLGYQTVTFNIGNTNGLGKPAVQIDKPFANNPKIRQAFSESIDRAALVKVVFNNMYSPACGPISPASKFSTPAAQACPKYDPAASLKLLKAAGVTTPVPITMMVTNSPDSLRLAQALQSMVKDGGFNLTINPVEYTTLLTDEDNGDYDAVQIGWSGRTDPDANITSFYATGASLNVQGYSNPAVDALLNQARQTSDVPTRAKLYGQAITKMNADNSTVYIYRASNLTGVSNTLKGVQVFPDGVVRVAFAGFAK